jgi:hypothetical protein
MLWTMQLGLACTFGTAAVLANAAAAGMPADIATPSG